MQGKNQGLWARAGGWRSKLKTQNSKFKIQNSEQVVDAVLLAKLERLALAPGSDLIRGLMGEHLARRRTAGIEFADYRPYTSGDDLSRVDWNAYARLGTLFVRQAQAEHDTVL